MIFWWLRVYATTRSPSVSWTFFRGFSVKSSGGLINFFFIVQPNGAILSEVFRNDNSYDRQCLRGILSTHMLVLCVTAGVFITSGNIRTNRRVKQSFFANNV